MSIYEALEMFLNSVRVVDRSEKTANNYEYHLGQYFRYLEANELNGDALFKVSVIENFLLHEERRGLSDYTVFGRYVSLRRWYNWLVEREEFAVDASPVDKIKRYKPSVEPVAANHDDLIALIEHIRSIQPRGWMEVRDATILEVFLASGIRLGEMAGLRVEDFDPSRRTLFICKGKGYKARIVPITPEVRTRLIEYLFNCPSSDMLWTGLINGRHKGTLSANGIRLMMNRRCKAAGIDRINPHSIRHLFAIRCLNNGMRLSALSQIMGHSSTEITMKYYARWLPDGIIHEYDLANRNIV